MVPLLVGCAYIGSFSQPPPSGTLELPSPSPTLETAPPTGTPAITPSPSASGSPGPSLSPSVEPEPSPTSAASPEPIATPAGSPEPSPSFSAGLRASNRFWEHWYDTCWFGAFPIVDSLAEITSESDLIVRGTIAELYDRRVRTWHVSMIRISIIDVVKGDPRLEGSSSVDTQVGYGGEDLSELRANLPAHEHLFFLKYLDEHPSGFYFTDYVQVSVLRGIDGVVEVIWPDAIANAYSRDHYPVPLDGTSFEKLVDRVRDLAIDQQASSLVPADPANATDALGALLPAC